MALSPADFAAYSRATGTPYPEDPEEKAELAPEVLEFRRNQLRAPQEESNLPGILGAVAAGLGVLGAGTYGAMQLAGRRPTQTKQTGLGVKQADLSIVATAPPLRATPSSSKVAVPPAAIPQATVDLTTLQQKEAPSVVSQQNKANDTGFDQQDYRNTVENKQRDIKEAQLTRRDKAQYVSPALSQLSEAGLPEFEINARIEAFANTGNRDFLDPSYNAATVEGGPTAFARALNVVNADVDRTGRIVSGDLVNPTGEVRRSFRGGKESVLELKEGDYDPLQDLFGVEGGVEVVETVDPSRKTLVTDPQEFLTRQTENLETRRIKQEKLSEQYQYGIDKFAAEWDTLHRAGPNTGIYFPSREAR
jgi:hypothetical protein